MFPSWGPPPTAFKKPIKSIAVKPRQPKATAKPLKKRVRPKRCQSLPFSVRGISSPAIRKRPLGKTPGKAPGGIFPVSPGGCSLPQSRQRREGARKESFAGPLEAQKRMDGRRALSRCLPPLPRYPSLLIFTLMPGRTFCPPSTITRSPGFKPATNRPRYGPRRQAGLPPCRRRPQGARKPAPSGRAAAPAAEPARRFHPRLR